jgi:hypothetical protein
MSKYLVLSFSILILVFACNQSPKTSQNPVPGTQSPQEHTSPDNVTIDPAETQSHEPSTPIGPEYPVKDVKKVFTVKIVDLNYTPEQKEKLQEAENKLAEIFNSKEYALAVIYRDPAFDSNNGLDNLQILNKLYAGAEALIPAVNYQMDLTVKMYNDTHSKVVGYTSPKSMIVYTNLKFHKKYTACEVASNLTHEWTHKMGFGHKTARSYNSVPYAHNEIIRKLCRQ